MQAQVQGMWYESQNHSRVVHRDIFVGAAKNCIYHALQCARCYTQAGNCKLSRLKPCRTSGYVMHSPKTRWKECMKIRYSLYVWLLPKGLPSMIATRLRLGALNSLMCSHDRIPSAASSSFHGTSMPATCCAL